MIPDRNGDLVPRPRHLHARARVRVGLVPLGQRGDLLAQPLDRGQGRQRQPIGAEARRHGEDQARDLQVARRIADRGVERLEVHRRERYPPRSPGDHKLTQGGGWLPLARVATPATWPSRRIAAAAPGRPAR